MKQNVEFELRKHVDDADFIFVGIGSELQVKPASLQKIDQFAKKRACIEGDKRYEWLIPFLMKYFLEYQYHQEIMQAYQKLFELLKDKNYFIVSLSTDDLLKQIPFREDRQVFPCGTFDMMQCEQNCQNKLFKVEQTLWSKVCEWIEDKRDFQTIQQPKCSDCGSPIVFNQYGQPVYNETGYLDHWQTYTKWLQGTVNQKLCILELGVGMEFPSIVRWPMEKVCFYNQKSYFYRVHEQLFQIEGDIKDRGTSIKQNALDFLQNL